MDTTQNEAKLPSGLKYIRNEDDIICQGCSCLVKAFKPMIVTTNIGKIKFTKFPVEDGLCLNCSANFLTDMSIATYERQVKTHNQYNALVDNINSLDENGKIMLQKLQLAMQMNSSFSKTVDDLVAYANDVVDHDYFVSEEELAKKIEEDAELDD